MSKSIIIIGAGLAGLATGCYGQMNGYETEIFESQAKPGGVCVSWKRKGYTFDYALHNLFGTSPDSPDKEVWMELGALRGLQTYSFKEFVQVEDTDGKTTMEIVIQEIVEDKITIDTGAPEPEPMPDL